MTIHRIKEILEDPSTNMARWLHDDTDYIEELIYVSPHETYYSVHAKIIIIPDMYIDTRVVINTQTNTISTKHESINYFQEEEGLSELITILYRHCFTSSKRNPQDDSCNRYLPKPETVIDPELINEEKEPPTRTIEELLEKDNK